ncbi:restriction endonuclease subunit S [Caldifermentibacillus hisashii]|uniref:Restriction endonuclease subunit S n=1 Tax=Caldifermentibacillus hisashii TaxID=996558 RepID=A0ABU9JVL4_9BACI
MSFNEWREEKLEDVIEFNPSETIKKGKVVKKIGMDKLMPFQRKIEGFVVTKYTSGTKFRNGDTLLARITPCLENGKTAQVSILEEGEVGFGSTEFIVLREKPGISDRNFIYYLSISPKLRDIAIKSMTGTSGRQRAQVDVIKNSIIKLPPIEEQRQIANILSSLDEKIEINNEINKKLEEMAQAIFKHWFVDFEFPNENGEPYKSSGGEMVESELGMIPKGWKVTKIGDVTKIVRGASPRPIQSYISNTGMPWVKISDASESNTKYIYKTKEFIKNEGISKSREVLPGTLILSNSATPGIPKFMLIKACVHDGWLIFNDYKDISKEYLYYCLIREREGILSLSNGSVFRNLKTDILKNYKIIIPDNKVLNKIQNYFFTTNKEIEKRTIENEVLINIRDTLLPKLMSGEIRVPVEEEK